MKGIKKNNSIVMTVKEAAELMGKSPSWVRAGIISGYFPVGFATRKGNLVDSVDEIHSPGRISYYIFREKVEEFIKGDTNGSGSELRSGS